MSWEEIGNLTLHQVNCEITDFADKEVCDEEIYETRQEAASAMFRCIEEKYRIDLMTADDASLLRFVSEETRKQKTANDLPTIRSMLVDYVICRGTSG